MSIRPDEDEEKRMKNNNIHYEPDYNLLNRKAKKNELVPQTSSSERLINRLLTGAKQPEPIANDPVLFEQLAAEISAIKADINWGQSLTDASYVVFDTETTGLHPYMNDEIMAIGALTINEAKISNDDSFYRLVNPRRPIPPVARRITGLDDQMVKDESQIIPVLLDFLRFCGPRILVAHNAPFDLAFINIKISETTGRRFVNPVIDTVLLTSALHYSIGDYSLENLSAVFKLDLSGRHHALGDARIAAELFLKLLPELINRGVTNLHQLAALFSDSDLTKGYPLIF
jgi:DNA polymerase III subunit epsilon